MKMVIVTKNYNYGNKKNMTINEIRKIPIEKRLYRVYIIKNTINKKIYIGQTCLPIKSRLAKHFSDSRSEKRRKLSPLYYDIHKYGEDKFYIETLEDNISYNDIYDKEMYYIERYNSINNGYNLRVGGKGSNKLTTKQQTDVINMALNGMTYKDIAKIFNVNNDLISNICRKNNIHVKNQTDYYYYKIKELYYNNYTIQQIANEMGLSTMYINYLLRKFNFRKERVYIANREDIDYEELKNDYNNGMSISDIIKKYDIARSTFYRIKNKLNIENRA